MASAPSALPFPVQKHARPYQRIDTLAIKQQLHDVLGENGLPYWQALTSFLTGRISRRELDELVDGWLGGSEKRLIPLHNHLLISLISNASNSPSTTSIPSSAPLSSKRARRPDDPTPYGAKKRVLGWVLGMPKRERERVRATQVLGAGGDESDEEGEEGQQGAREERRKGGAGWMGGSEMERERVVLGPANGARPNADGNSVPPTPTMSSLSRPRTALESRSIPSSDQLKDRIARISSENGLEGAGPGVGRFLGLAVDTHLKSLITTHLHMHRSNLQSSPSIHPSKPKTTTTSSTISDSAVAAAVPPSLVPSEPASPSATSSTSTYSGGPQTPPNTFTMHALEGVLGSASAGLAMDLGNVGRVVGGRLMEEREWEEIWGEAEKEGKKWGVGEVVKGKEVKKEEGVEEEKVGEKGKAGEEKAGGEGKKKKKDHAYDYVDPRSILDSVLG